MSQYREAMSELRNTTSPDTASVARVRARLRAATVPTTELLRSVDRSTASVEVAVRRRMTQPVPRRWPRVAAVGGLAFGGLAFAAGMVQLLPEPATAPTAAEPMSAHLNASETETVRPMNGLVITYAGAGTFDEEPGGISGDWETGWVDVDVQGALELRTREAIVVLHASRIHLERDAFGTHVNATEGEVDVRCVAGGRSALHTGDHTSCGPASAAGLLGMARAQRVRGDAPRALLDTLDAGLSVADVEDPVRAELVAARIEPLAELDQHAEALAAAEAYLELDGPRSSSIRHAAAALALTKGGCELALPHLESLDAPTDVERAHLIRCRR